MTGAAIHGSAISACISRLKFSAQNGSPASNVSTVVTMKVASATAAGRAGLVREAVWSFASTGGLALIQAVRSVSWGGSIRGGENEEKFGNYPAGHADRRLALGGAGAGISPEARRSRRL